MCWDQYLHTGDAYTRGELLGAAGFAAAWSFLFPRKTVSWLRENVSPGELDKIAKCWGDVWWNYLCACAGVRPTLLSGAEATCVIHIGCEAMRTSARFRSVFLAVMFQLAVAGRHDQMVCSIEGDPKAPPFYSEYVSRSKIGSTFSLRSLLRCEDRYACAQRTASRFRGVKGRVVAAIYTPGGAELMRLGRTKLYRFMCSRCDAKRPRAGCRKCSRLQEHNSNGIVSYFGEHRSYVRAHDVQTVCGDVVFVMVKDLKEGDVVLEHDKSGSFNMRVVSVACLPCGRLRVSLSDKLGRTAAWDRMPKSVAPVVPCRPDTAKMMRENPDVVHGMGMSVHPDKISERWSDDKLSCSYPTAALTPIQLSSLKGKHLKEYALWRSLAAMVRHLLPKEAPKHARDALAVTNTHCLHHHDHSFAKR